jgi:NADH-quinone oxidoreductase subunit J
MSLFSGAAIVAVIATALALTRANVIHALLYFIVSLLAVALIFFVIGAPFVAALEVIVYAGAIMVLFVFVVMLLNLGPRSVGQERAWVSRRVWIGPLVLAAILLVDLVWAIAAPPVGRGAAGSVIEARQVGADLFGRYALGVEMASMLLLAGLIGTFHLGRRDAATPGAPRRDRGGR